MSWRCVDASLREYTKLKACQVFCPLVLQQNGTELSIARRFRRLANPLMKRWNCLWSNDLQLSPSSKPAFLICESPNIVSTKAQLTPRQTDAKVTYCRLRLTVSYPASPGLFTSSTAFHSYSRIHFALVHTVVQGFLHRLTIRSRPRCFTAPTAGLQSSPCTLTLHQSCWHRATVFASRRRLSRSTHNGDLSNAQRKEIDSWIKTKTLDFGL